MKRALLLALLAGCGGPTEIVVRVETALRLNDPLTGITGATTKFEDVCFDLQEVAPPYGTLIEPPTGDPTWSSSVAAPTSCAPIELAVVSRGGTSHEAFGIRVRGTSDCASTSSVYLQTTGSTNFVDGRVSLLTLTLDARCTADPAAEGTVCQSDEMCDPATSKCVAIVPVAPVPYSAPAACP